MATFNKLHLKIENLASEIISNNGIMAPSIDIEKIVSNEGLRVTSYDLGDDVSGALVVENGKGAIGYNPNDSILRRRFTIAHEYGHFLLHSETQRLFVDKDFLIKFRNANKYTQNEIIQEQEANAFAAAILMPRHMIKKEINKPRFNNLSESVLIQQLAHIFEVSEIAMSYRITNIAAYLWK